MDPSLNKSSNHETKQKLDPHQVSLFITCVIDQLYPEVGEATVSVLRKLGVKIEFPKNQTCCGQVAFNSGFWDDARPLAKRLIDQFRENRYVVVPSGSCASMIRVFYKELLKDDPEILVEALELSSRVYEFSEFIVDVLEINNFGPPDQMVNLGQKVTYHEGCHLRRELNVITQPKKLIKALPGIELRDMEQAEVCCGFGGTFSVKYPDISAAMLQDKLDNIQATGADSVTACDSSCLMQIDGGLKRQNIPIKATHVAQLIDEILEDQNT